MGQPEDKWKLFLRTKTSQGTKHCINTHKLTCCLHVVERRKFCSQITEPFQNSLTHSCCLTHSVPPLSLRSKPRCHLPTFSWSLPGQVLQDSGHWASTPASHKSRASCVCIEKLKSDSYLEPSQTPQLLMLVV